MREAFVPGNRYSGAAVFRKTKDDKLLALLRVVLAALFLFAGYVKVFDEEMVVAFGKQVEAAGLPLQDLTRWTLPYLEMALGVALLVGAYTRFASMVLIAIMVAAAYAHITVDDASLFPMQPSGPIIPLGAIAMALFLVLRGAGAWSLDRRATRSK